MIEPRRNPDETGLTLPFVRASVIGLILLLLDGCASEGLADPDRYRVGLTGDSALHRGALDRQPLLEGGLKFRAPDRLLNYDAGYVLKPGGNLLQNDVNATGSATTTSLLGGESFGQEVHTRLPFFEAPLLFGAQDRYRGLLTPQGTSAMRTAQLNWSPQPANFGLQWSTPDALAPQPFECSLRGSIDVPGTAIAAGSEDALKLTGRGCRVVAPDRGIANLDVNAYSAAWQWRAAAGDNGVHLTMIELQRHQADTAAAFEVGASRTQKRGALSAKTSVAVRRATDPLSRREATAWSARATVSRQFEGVAVSASVQHAPDPLWFVPASTSGGNRFELGFDFRRWIDTLLSTPHIGMGLTWSWTQPPVANQPIDARVLWNFSVFR